jgi:hypothetical protein
MSEKESHFELTTAKQETKLCSGRSGTEIGDTAPGTEKNIDRKPQHKLTQTRVHVKRRQLDNYTLMSHGVRISSINTLESVVRTFHSLNLGFSAVLGLPVGIPFGTFAI